MLEKTTASAGELEHALSRLAYLLELQLGLSRGEYRMRKVENQLAQEGLKPRCTI